MPSMIESLIGGGVRRPDRKRITPSRRPLPARPRDLFELFVTLGQEASLPSLAKASDLRGAEARHMTFIALSRWPTAEELADMPAPYDAADHLRDLIASREFRTHLVRRLCDAYPERPRMLYVRIPRCAGEHFMHMAGAMHAIFPPALLAWRLGDQQRFVPALGGYLGRFNLTRTILIALPRLAPFVQAAPPRAAAEQALHWSLNPPPRRPGDRLFTILRDPASLVLSQVNATLTALRAPPREDTPDTAAWRTRLGSLPRDADHAGWKALGLRLLGDLPMRNPICHALGDGTAQDALLNARVSDIEIADLGLYADWVKYTWDVEPEPPANTSQAVLAPDDLGRASARLEAMIDHDVVFYARVKTLLADLGELKTSIRGRDL